MSYYWQQLAVVVNECEKFLLELTESSALCFFLGELHSTDNLLLVEVLEKKDCRRDLKHASIIDTSDNAQLFLWGWGYL